MLNRGLLSLCLGLVLALFAAGCADLVSTPATQPKELAFRAAKWSGDGAELPITCAGGNILLNVRVGQHDYVMLLDTGAICTMVSPRLVQNEGGKAGYEAVEVADMAGTIRSLPTAAIPGIRIGTMQTAPVTVAVRDLSRLSALVGANIDLVGGLPLFHEVLLTVDYPARRMRLARGSLPAPDGNEVLRLQLAQGQRYLMPLTIAGCEIWAVPDTGCTSGIVCPAWAETLFPGAKETPRRQKVQFWEGRGDSGYLAVNGELRVGSTTSANPVIALAGQADPLVGYQLMDSFEVTIDQRAQRIRFRKTRPEPLQLAGQLTTGIALSPDLQVVAILPGSGAERAGIKLGDRVVGVNHRPLTLQNVNNRSIRLPQTLYDKLNLTVERDGRKVDLSFTMAPMPAER